MPFKKSLAFRIFIISFILLALPLLVDTFVIVQGRYNDSIAKAKEFLVKTPASRIFVLSRSLQERKRALTFAEYFLQLSTHFPAEESSDLNSQLQRLAKAGDFEDVILLKINEDNTQKVVGYSFERGTVKDFQSYDFYSKIAERKLGSDDYTFLFTFNGKYYFLVGHTVYSPDRKQKLGVILFLMDITEKLKEFLAPSIGIYNLQYALLIPNTIVIASPHDPSLESSYFYELSPDMISKYISEQLVQDIDIKPNPLEVEEKIGAPFLNFVWQGKNYIGVISPIPETSYMLLSYVPEDLLLANPFLSFFPIYVIFGLILLVGAQLAYYFSHRISRPFRQLSSVMEGIQKGDLSKRYRHDRLGFEINALGFAFNEMIDTLLEKKYLAEEEKVKGEIYDKELRIGQQIQRGLFPTEIPTYHGIEMAQRYLPAKEVGGDFYDIFVREYDGREQLALVIADASGKGIQACFYSLGVRSNLRVFAREYENADLIIKRVNSLFYHDSGDSGMFVTVLLGIYDPKSRELSYSSSGHNPPILRKANGQIVVLGQSKMVMALGIKKDLDSVSEKVQLDPGDVLVFYTDGITETHDENNMLFGEERLENFIREKGGGSVEKTAEELIAEVRRFQGKAPQHDDITLLLMKVVS